jgi:hypothetical protein
MAGNRRYWDQQMEISDILFLVVWVWLAIALSDGGGGGRRARVPAF